MHDEDQCALQAVEDGENVRNGNRGILLKQEDPRYPHQTQNTHLGYSCHSESFNFVQVGEVWVEAGKLLGKFPDGDDKEEDIHKDD